jgi:hypothetical protein
MSKRERRQAVPVTWTEEMLRELARLWRAGKHTMLEIAVALSSPRHPMSRNCVAGMIRRHGLARNPLGPRDPQAQPAKREKPRKPRERVRKPKVAKVPEVAPKPVEEVRKPAETTLVGNWRVPGRVRQCRSLPADGTPIPLLDLGVGCKWPVDIRGDEHLFCNLPRVTESYCREHQAKSLGARAGAR